MRYKLLYTRWKAQQKAVVILDFLEEKIIELTLDESTIKDAEEELKRFLTSIEEEINNRYWLYED